MSLSSATRMRASEAGTGSGAGAGVATRCGSPQPGSATARNGRMTAELGALAGAAVDAHLAAKGVDE